MTVKLGVSLSDATHGAAVSAAAHEGLPLSTFIDQVLARELFRRGVSDHNAMLREAGLADPKRLRTKAAALRTHHEEWKLPQRRSGESGAT